MTNFVLEAVASLARLAVHFDDSDKGDGMRNLAVKARQQHDAERAVIEAAKTVVADLPMIEGEPVPYPFAKSLHAQKRAVEALEEVERD